MYQFASYLRNVATRKLHVNWEELKLSLKNQITREQTKNTWEMDIVKTRPGLASEKNTFSSFTAAHYVHFSLNKKSLQ